ncbi:hypothetical protein [Streptomyces sp. NBC_01750]|uniref:hypothetical protein n=1 Tax=Streptomyces sp. NBC_01750 TaxID=2975928 RepID=UPI002DD9D910|nr:hypothetical protein [Streptomyces sp. NBC_01750]WSD30601.1 hypothetical protein OG966_00540 [Streptomyces sp. NBC_01750]
MASETLQKAARISGLKGEALRPLVVAGCLPSHHKVMQDVRDASLCGLEHEAFGCLEVPGLIPRTGKPFQGRRLAVSKALKGEILSLFSLADLLA